jgi:hypothetical protein
MFKIYFNPDQSSSIGLWCDLHICAHLAQTIPALSALKIYQIAHLITFFLNIQTELVFSLSGKNGVYFMFCYWASIKHAQFHISTQQQRT